MDKRELQRLLTDAIRGTTDARKHLAVPEMAVAYIRGAIARLGLVLAELETEGTADD